MCSAQLKYESDAICPLSGKLGELKRTMTPRKLFAAYEKHFSICLPDDIIERYFAHTYYEYESDYSGLRWYRPIVLGLQDYYELLSNSLRWYYRFGWDKKLGLDLLINNSLCNVLEVGCGNGQFLKKASECGINACGMDINTVAVERASLNGIKAYLPENLPRLHEKVDALCLFQVLEHVADPVSFLMDLIDLHKPKNVFISAPNHEALIGYGSDPLVWPPHHVTSWSKRGFELLATKIGYKLSAVYYDNQTYAEFRNYLKHDSSLHLPIENRWFELLPLLLQFGLGRINNKRWSLSKHSVFGVFSQVHG